MSAWESVDGPERRSIVDWIVALSTLGFRYFWHSTRRSVPGVELGFDRLSSVLAILGDRSFAINLWRHIIKVLIIRRLN